MRYLRKLPPEAVVLAWLLARLTLYWFPVLLGAGYTDAFHVLFEGAAAILLLVPALREDPLPRSEGRGRPRYALAAAVLLPVFLASYVAAQAVYLVDKVPYYGDPEDMLGEGMLVWYALRTCVTAPVMEELGCRWLAFGKLRRRGAGFWPSALASVLPFSVIHAGAGLDVAAAVVPGALLYCLIYDLAGSPWLGMAVHAARNLMSLPGTPWAGSGPDRLLDNLMYGVPQSASVPALLAVTAVMVLLCAYRDRFFRR